jgi:ABC-type protease/lipase transport system fused ATPase/permease subunit
MTDDLVKRLRESAVGWDELGFHVDAKMDRDAANRIEELEAALRKCEFIVARAQKENEIDTEWKGSKTRQVKARAVASRCGMLLGEIRKHVRSALGGEER